MVAPCSGQEAVRRREGQYQLENPDSFALRYAIVRDDIRLRDHVWSDSDRPSFLFILDDPKREV